jgi:mono/diheme cytochrome c family protein
MGNAKVTSGIVAIGLVLMAPASMWAADTAPDAAAAAKGRVTFGRYCVSCHGPQAKGDGPIARDLRVVVPDLTTLAQRSGGKFPNERVVQVIQDGATVRGHGTADMPAWGDAFKKTKGTGEATVDAAIRNLSQYLRTLQQPAR